MSRLRERLERLHRKRPTDLPPPRDDASSPHAPPRGGAAPIPDTRHPNPARPDAPAGDVPPTRAPEPQDTPAGAAGRTRGAQPPRATRLPAGTADTPEPPAVSPSPLRNARALDPLRDPGRARIRAVRDPMTQARAPRLRMVPADDPAPGAAPRRDLQPDRPVHTPTQERPRPNPRLPASRGPHSAERVRPGVLPALRYATAHGVVHVVRTEHDPLALHGENTLGGWLGQVDIPPGTVALDLETTGLSAARGAVLAMAGLAFVGNDMRIVVEQSLLITPGEERAGLVWLARHLERASLVWTWNGKRFDLPFISACAERCGIPVPEPPHVDQYLAERGSGRPGRLRLTDVEARRLGLHRDDDLPGSEAPARFEEFFTTGRFEAVAPVLEHNRIDVISTLLLGGLALRDAE